MNMPAKERSAADEAFGALYQQYHGLVYRIAYAFVKDDFLAQDIAQEVFIKIFAHLGTVDGVNNKRAWVKAIARNKAIDFCRKHSRRLVLLTGQIERWAGPAETGAGREGHPSVDDAFSMLDKLEPKFRQPLLLLYVHGMSYNQIADAQNTTLGAVKTRIHRAKKKTAHLAGPGFGSGLRPAGDRDGTAALTPPTRHPGSEASCFSIAGSASIRTAVCSWRRPCWRSTII